MLQIKDSVLADTFVYLRTCLPEEGVVLWSGQIDHVTAWKPLCNTAPYPRIHYAVSPQEWLDALREVTTQGRQPLALVHSHPTASDVPSRIDRRQWYYPELWCVIVSFAGAEPTWQAHRIASI